MSATIKELFESRRGGVGPDGNMTLMYVVQGTDDLATVRSTVDATAPATFDEKKIGPSYEVEEAGPSTWIVRVPYGPDDLTRRTSSDAAEQTFELSAETVNTQVSLATISKTPGSAPSFDQLVNVSVRNGRIQVDGADVLHPRYEFTLEKIYTNAVLSESKRKEWADQVGTVNAAILRQFAIATVLYMGQTGRRRGRGDWSVNHRFAYSPDRTDVTIGEHTVASVPGWAYLWVTYEEIEDEVAHVIRSKPTAVYVERMYNTSNFTNFAL